MKIEFHVPAAAESVDMISGIIRGVSVITSGLIARGHDLEVDNVTLDQMQKCAMARGQVPVKIDHSSGAASIVGYLTNFRREANKLKADWHLLESHPQRNQILETVARMPSGVGLSASFVSPSDAPVGKARCAELVTVDYVTLPAANPDGVFSRRDLVPPPSGLEKVRRVLAAAGRGAEGGALLGVAGRALFHRPKGPSVGSAATTGAVLGALTKGAQQYRRDRKRDFAARVTHHVFESRAAGLRRVADAVADNIDVPVPGAEQARTAIHYAKKPLVSRIATRALKVGVGATGGYLIGRRYGAQAGAITGAVAGLLFENADVRNTVRRANQHAKQVITL